MSAADLLEDGFPHGTVAGFDGGCRGGHCPGEEEHGISCRRAKHLAAGDWRYNRLVAQGLTPAEIAAELGETPHQHPAPEPRRIVTDDEDEDVQVDDLDEEEPIEGEDPIMNTTTAPSPATIIKSRKPEPQDVPEWPDEVSESSDTSNQATAEPEEASTELDLKPATIRAWALDSGIPVGTKGKVRTDVVEAYMVAHGHITVEVPAEVSETWPGNDGDRVESDPTHGRVDKDIQEKVDAMRPSTLGQRVAMEQTLQDQRGELAALNAEADGEPDLIPTVEEYGSRLRAIQQRQIEKGYTPEHDDAHGVRHLLNWAIDYARRGRTDDAAGLVLSALGSLDRTEAHVVVHGPVADMETRAELFNEGWDEARRQSVEATIETLADSLEFALAQWARAADRAAAATLRAEVAESALADARRPWWKRRSA